MVKDIAIYLFIMIILVSVTDDMAPMVSFLAALGAFIWVIMVTIRRW